MIESIKRKIKVIKLSTIIFWIIFILMIFSNIFLIIKTYKLENQNQKIEKELNGFKNILHFKE